jgi:Lon protease-like protein
MFPLGTVLFPHALLPLQVFEPRYRVMMRHLLDGDREFGVVLIERGSEVGGGDVRFDVGSVARIVQASELPDGRWALVAAGVRRLRVVRWLPDDPYPRADVEEIEEGVVAGDAGAARERVAEAFAEVVSRLQRLGAQIERLPTFDPDPVQGVYEMAAAAPIEALDAQRVLAAADLPARSDLLARMLHERALDLEARFTE